MGIYDQAIWQYSRFLNPFNTIIQRHILGDHLSLTLPLLAPLYWIWNDVRILLIFQSVWICFSVLAIYKLAKLRKFSNFTSLSISFIFSIFYGIQQAIYFDFHPIVIAVGLLVWMTYFLESKQIKFFWIFLTLALLTQENTGIAVICLGLYYLFKNQYRRTGLILMIIGLIWSPIAIVIIKHFSNIGFEYWPDIPSSPRAFIFGLFNQEEKRQVWFYSFSWFSFLPIFSPGALLAVTADLSQYFVTGKNFFQMWSPYMHHRAILDLFLTLGTLDGIMLFKKIKVKPIVLTIILLLICIFLQYYYHFPLNKLTKSAYWKEESWMDDNQKMISSLNPEAKIVTQQNLIPHISHRVDIRLAWPRQHSDIQSCQQPNCWWLDFGGQPDYLLVDLHPNQWITQLLETNENFSSAVNNMEQSGKIKLVNKINNIYLYEVSN